MVRIMIHSPDTVTEYSLVLLTFFTDPACNDTDIRLVGGSRLNEGRVEYCSEGVWGSVCGDIWGRNNSLVVCRQLGLPTESKQSAKSNDIVCYYIYCLQMSWRFSGLVEVIGLHY